MHLDPDSRKIHAAGTLLGLVILSAALTGGALYLLWRTIL